MDNKQLAAYFILLLFWGLFLAGFLYPRKEKSARMLYAHIVFTQYDWGGSRLPKIQISGDKATVKIPLTIESQLNSCRYPLPEFEERGMQNPRHIHVRIPRRLFRKDEE